VAEEINRLSSAAAWPMHFVSLGADGRGWGFPHDGPDGDFVYFEMLSDVCYIDMRDLHDAIRTLAPGLQDAHLFVYSSGDNDDRWVDEIHIRDGSAMVDRWLAEPDADLGFLPLCEALLTARDYDTAFRRFVSYLHADQIPWIVYRAYGAAQEREEQPSSAEMFSPHRRDSIQLRARARVIASLDPVRQERVLHHLTRALAIDNWNILAYDLLDAWADLQHHSTTPDLRHS
jgi:hypothetical protein